jgi:hypothetical protein
MHEVGINLDKELSEAMEAAQSADIGTVSSKVNLTSDDM